MYKIEFSDKARKQFLKLPYSLQNRMGSVLERIKLRPYSFVKRLIGTSYFRLRVGDYRIILDIQDKKLLISLIELGHRRSIYKK